MYAQQKRSEDMDHVVRWTFRPATATYDVIGTSGVKEHNEKVILHWRGIYIVLISFTHLSFTTRFSIRPLQIATIHSSDSCAHRRVHIKKDVKQIWRSKQNLPAPSRVRMRGRRES